MVIVDTNIIIDHLRQTPDTNSLLRYLEEKIGRNNIGLSVISIQELYVGKSTNHVLAESLMMKTISQFRLLPYTIEVAVVAGKIVRELANPLQFADAAIAATAIHHRAKLYTLNKKDFLGINSLEIER